MIFKYGSRLLAGGLGLVGCAGTSLNNSRSGLRFLSVSAQGDPAVAKSIHEFSAKSIDGEEVELSKYKGQVCVVVNVASK